MEQQKNIRKCGFIAVIISGSIFTAILSSHQKGQYNKSVENGKSERNVNEEEYLGFLLL